MEIKHIRHWGAISRWDQCIPDPGHARDELQECYGWKWANWGLTDQNLLLPTAPWSQLCTALTVCTWTDDIIWKRPQISCISYKTHYLHLQVPKHLKLPPITHKYQSRDCKHVFLPPLISSSETKFTAGPSPLLASPATCSSCLCKWGSDTFLQFKLRLLSAQLIAWSYDWQCYLSPACVPCTVFHCRLRGLWVEPLPMCFRPSI